MYIKENYTKSKVKNTNKHFEYNQIRTKNDSK